jgi:hypothetical protein
LGQETSLSEADKHVAEELQIAAAAGAAIDAWI